MAEAPWRARDSVLCGAICFLLLVLLHQIQTRASLSDLSSTIDETREVATDLSMEHQRLAAELARLEKAVAMSTGKPLPSLPPLDGARGYDGTPHAVQYRSTVPGGLGCVGWRQTGGCAADGPRESDADKGCETRILSKWSGYCECENGTTTHAVGCLHADFTCATACEQQPALAAERAANQRDGPLTQQWLRVVGKPVPADPSALPTAEMSSFVDDLGDARAEDCPEGSREFYERVPIVYTWVNGSEAGYAAGREGAGGAKAVGGARDRDNGELRFSLRSIERYLPWWKGVVYIVAPAQTPSWIDRAHPRLRIIDQDALFPEEDCDTLPTFNTNAIEQWLWRVPGLADAAKVAGHGPLFVHMNDDYIFTAPIRPQDLFGKTCAGMRLLYERGVVKHRSQSELDEMRQKGGRTWVNSVANSVFALDKRYNPASEHPYLKHAPFVYSVEGCRAVADEYRVELRTTMEHKFRDAADVIYPLLHHGYMRGEGAESLGIPLSIATPAEALELMLLSLSGDEPPDPKHPKKKTAAQEHASQRASKWYSSILSGETRCRMVTLNDEMPTPNATVVAQLHHFLLAVAPEPSVFEAEAFTPCELPHTTERERLEFDIETHRPGLLARLGFRQVAPHHDKDDGMRRRKG